MPIYHSFNTCHYVGGGYSDWTPAEQREWDRDIEKLEAEHEQREFTAKTENEDKLHWLELAIDDPMFKITYNRVFGSNLYVVDITEQPPSKEGARNIDFEVVYPLYQGLNEITEMRKTPKTTQMKIEVSSREHWDVTYTCEFSPDQWCYTTIDEIMEALADQLTMKQNLNQGLLMKMFLYEK